MKLRINAFTPKILVLIQLVCTIFVLCISTKDIAAQSTKGTNKAELTQVNNVSPIEVAVDPRIELLSIILLATANLTKTDLRNTLPMWTNTLRASENIPPSIMLAGCARKERFAAMLL